MNKFTQCFSTLQGPCLHRLQFSYHPRWKQFARSIELKDGTLENVPRKSRIALAAFDHRQDCLVVTKVMQVLSKDITLSIPFFREPQNNSQ